MMQHLGRKGVARLIGDSEQIDQLTEIVATLETELLIEVAELDRVAGTDPVAVPETEARRDQLTEVFQAMIEGPAAIEELYVEQVLQERLDHPEMAREYLGIEPEEWEAQIQTWGKKYRESGANGEDRDLAAKHVRSVFGVSLDEFEDNVALWSPGEFLEATIAANFRAAQSGIIEARQAVEDQLGEEGNDG